MVIRFILICCLSFLSYQLGAQTHVAPFEYRLSVGVNSNSESSDEMDSGLEYAGLGWHVHNSFYFGKVHRPKISIGFEQTKSVTNLNTRFDLTPNIEEDVDPKAINSTFFKMGAGGQFLLKYSPVVLLYAEGVINYNVLSGRDVDRILEQERAAYDLTNHWDFEVGFFARRQRISLGLIYSRNISDISQSIESLNKNVVSIDLGYTFGKSNRKP